MNIKNIFSLGFLIFTVLFLASCGNGGSGSVTGHFIDDRVEGLVYHCSSGDFHETDANGEFTCPNGDDVTFYLGANQLGPVPAVSSLITPYTLFPDDPVAAINLARLLQSIDMDGDPNNGVIVADAQLVSSLPGNINFSSPTFDSDLESIPGLYLVSAAQAQTHLDESIAEYIAEFQLGGHVPVANAGADQSVITGDMVFLNGSGFDADGDTLTYSWGMLKPLASSAAIVDWFNNISPTFVPDVEGVYEIVLMVSDGVFTHVDRVFITAADSADDPGISNDANLSALTLSVGTLSPAFNASTLNYATTVVNATNSITVTPTTADVNAAVTVNGTIVASGAVSTAIALAVGSNAITVTVTAEDGIASKTYAVTVTREAVIGASDNADLSGLTLSASTLLPAFSASTISYATTVVNDTDSTTVTPTTADTNATVIVNGTMVASGTASTAIALAVGVNTISVVVTAEDGIASKTYAVTITREAVIGASDNVDLSGLTLSASTLLPAFSASTISYATTVVNDTDSTTVTPTTADTNATVIVNGTMVASGTASTAIALAVGVNTISVVVTAEDGIASKTYTVTVTREAVIGASSDAELSALALSDGILTPAFNATTTDYTATVNNATATVTVTPTTSDANATVTVNGATVASGSASGAIALSVGINTIDVVVTAEDGATRITYNISLTREVPPAPLGLRTTAGDALVTLSWSEVTVADRYTVYWNTTGSVSTSDNIIDAAGSTQITHTGLSSGTTYYYRVSASNASAEGELSAEVSSTQYPSDWEWGNSLPQGNRLRNIAWDGSQFVAVGNYGTILSSTDGQTWITQNSGTILGLSDIIWDGDSSRFVAVGSFGTVLTSPDGISWTSQESGTTYSLAGITWSGSQYVVVGGAGTFLTSPDGIDWTTHIVPLTSRTSLIDVAWNGSQFVAVASGSGIYNYVYYSSNGVSWTRQHLSYSGDGDSIATDGSQFVVVGYDLISTSPDGITWTERDSSQLGLNGVTWDGAQFIAVGSGKVVTSPGGITWTEQSVDTRLQPLNGVIRGGSQYVAVGYAGNILTSTDTVTWSLQSSGETRWLTDITWSGTQFVAVGQSIILSSHDGLTWIKREQGYSEPWPNGAYLMGIIWSGSQFVTVGSNGGLGIITSPDGVTWSPQTSGTSSTLRDIAWDGSQFVAVGDSGTILTSPGGIDWSAQSSGVTETLEKIIWNGSQFVAVGHYETILTSSDGITWVTQNSSDTSVRALDGIAWDGNQFVVTGSGEGLLTSPDGITWTVQDADTKGDVIWNGSQFIAVDQSSNIYTSPDGLIWTSKNILTGNNSAIAWGDGLVVIVGSFGTIISNDSF